MKTCFQAAIVAFFTLVSSNLYAKKLIKAPAWQAFETFAFADDQGYKTNSVLVMVDGKVEFERYRSGFDATTSQQLWSISKSISGLMIGIASRDNLIKTSDSIQKYFPKAPKKVTIDHLLNMVSGYKWNEGYEYSPVGSDVIAMLYTSHFDDMASFAANRPLNHEPETFFQYSSGTTNVLMGALRKAMGPSDYARYPWRSFFEPLEISSAVWERDHAGTFVGSSYLYLNARDLAKIGQLFLDKGKYKGKEIIPAAWLEASAQTHPYFLNPERELKESENFAYSRQWWLNTALPFPDGSYKSRYPNLPANAVLGLGHWGQMLVIIPDQKVVIVRTGEDKSGRMNRDEFFGRFMHALRQAYP